MGKTIKLTCIAARKSNGLTEGKKYAVKEGRDSQYWEVINDNGEKKNFHKSRFESIKSAPEPKPQVGFPEFLQDVPAVKAVEVLDPVKLSAQLDKTTDYIRKEVGNVAKSFCRIGFKLYEVREQKQYVGKEYKNVYEYAEYVLGFKKASTANYIAVCERFSVRGKDNKPTAQLMPNFSSFSYTQLSEMLPLSDEVIADITPDATCKDIREIKKGAKGSAGGSGDRTDNDEEQITLEPQETQDIVRHIIFNEAFTGVNADKVHAALFEYIGYDIEISVRVIKKADYCSKE